MKSLPRIDLQTVFTFLIPFLLLSLLVDRSQCAPTVEGDDVDGGCYYMFNHYGEGDRILTNEPCLNCTCHNSMLMCYLRVCPFTKPIGQDCTIEKKPDQCCPVISCPQVPVSLVTPSALTSTTVPTTSLASVTGSTELATFERGCEIEGKNYPDGAQVIGDPSKPCELCYCIRNRTACVMQECILHVEGCEPIFQSGVCCPVRYQCDYPPQLTDQSTVAGLITTTISSLFSSTPQPGGCFMEGDYYADGSQILGAGPSPSPCEHCYCMRGEIVCAVQECGTPLENEGANCTAIPPGPGLCCPDKYTCESDQITSDEIGTTMSTLDTVGSSDSSLQSQGLELPSDDDSTLENQTQAIPVSLEPFVSSTEESSTPKEIDNSTEKVASSTIGQEMTSAGSESTTHAADRLQELSSSTNQPEHDIIIDETEKNETDMEAHSRVSEKPIIVPSPDLEDESFIGTVTTQKAVSDDDVQPSEIMQEENKVVDLSQINNVTSEQVIPEVQGSMTTEKAESVSESATGTPDSTSVRPDSVQETGASEGTQPLLGESTDSPVTEASLSDEGTLLETSTERISGSSEKPIESSTDKLLESSTENLLVISEAPRTTEKPVSMDNEESSTDKIMMSSEKPIEGSTAENLIVSSDQASESSTENALLSTTKQSESSTDSALEPSTTKPIESSTDNLIVSSEKTPELSSEEPMSEVASDDKPVVGTDDETSSISPSTSDNETEVTFTTVRIPTGEQSVSEPEKVEADQTPIADEGTVTGSTTPEPLKDSAITGESDGVETPTEKYADATVEPAVDIQDSQLSVTTQSTVSDKPDEPEAAVEEKHTFDETVTTLRPDGESSPQSTEGLDEKIKEPQLSMDEQTLTTIEAGKITSTTLASSVLGDLIEGSSSPIPDLSELPTTQKTSMIGETANDQQETIGEDEIQVTTASSVIQHDVSSSSASSIPEAGAVSETEKESESSQVPSSSSRPNEQDGIIMGEFTVSSTPEAPESLSMHTTSTSSPDMVSSSSTSSSVLPPGSEAENEIGEDAKDKISDEPTPPEITDISSKPSTSTISSDLDGPLSTSQPSISESSVVGLGQEDSERTSTSSPISESNTEVPLSDSSKSTEIPVGVDDVEKDSDKNTEVPPTKLAGIETGSDLETATGSAMKPFGEAVEQEKSTETPISPSVVPEATETPEKLADEGNVQDLDKLTEAPTKLSEEESGSEMDKTTETPIKLAAEEVGSGLDTVTETPGKLADEASVPEVGVSTEATEKLAGEEIGSSLSTPTETPIKLGDEEVGSDKVTETPEKVADTESSSDVDKPTETPVKLTGEEMTLDSEKSTETPVKLSEEKVESSSDVPTETPMKVSDEGNLLVSEISTEPAVKLTVDESGSDPDMDKATEAPIKTSDQPSTVTPVKLAGEQTDEDMNKTTETPTKLIEEGILSDSEASTETPIKLAGEESVSDVDKATEMPMKPTEADNEIESEKPTEVSVKPGTEQQDEPESVKSPEDQVALQDQSDLEKTTRVPTELSSSTTEEDAKSTDIPLHSLVVSESPEMSTQTPIQSDSPAMEMSSISSLTPDATTTEKAEKVTEQPSSADAAAQDETDVSATEVPAKPISVQNQQIGDEIIISTSIRPETDQEQSNVEKVTEASLMPLQEQVDSETVTQVPQQPLGDMIKDKVSAVEEVPSADAIQPDLTESGDTVTTLKPMSEDSLSVTTSGPNVEDEKSTTNVTSQNEVDSALSDSLPSNITPEMSLGQSSDATTKPSADTSEGSETTQTPDASEIKSPDQTLVEIPKEPTEGQTTLSPVVDGVTKLSENEQGMTEGSVVHGGASDDGTAHDEPEKVEAITGAPVSVSVPESDGSSGMTTIAPEASELPTTFKPLAAEISDSEQSTISSIDPIMDSSTKASSQDTTEGLAQQDDQNTESTVSENQMPIEAMTNGTNELPEGQLADNLTTVRPLVLDDSSRDPEEAAAPTIAPSDAQEGSTGKPIDTTETSKPSEVPDMSDVAAEKLHDSTTDIVLTDTEVTGSPSRVPGEGNCFVEGQTYKNGSSIPPTTPCHIVCACQNSIVHCLLVHCPPPPNNYGDCKPIYRSGVCCPEYDCGGSDDSAVTVTPGPGLSLTKEDVNFVTVTPETPSLESNEASQDESSISDTLNATNVVTTSRPLSGSESVETSDSSSQESEEDKSVGSGILKPIQDTSPETSSSDFEDSSQNSISSTTSEASSLVSEQTSQKPVISEEESFEDSVNATGPGSMFASSESPSSVDTSSLSPISEGILDASKLEDALNITSDAESSPIPPGSYYPVTTTTSVTPSQATWPYPTSTPSSVMSTGACLFDGRVYMSAQQIPRDDPCDFCFCFRGDIICLQQSCPPPIPGCYEEPIPGFCCPRYECPVGNGNVTTQPPLFPPSYYHNQILNGVASGQTPGAIANMPSGPGCEIQGEYYESGQVITSTSGPCLECRCGATGMMECDPRECQPEPMLRKMIAAITSR